MDVHYPEAEKIRLVMDNLNTHSGVSRRGVPARRGATAAGSAGDSPDPQALELAGMAEIELRIMNRTSGSADR